MTGVKREWVAPHDFAMLHFDLVDALGGSLEAALLLDRIIFYGRDEGWVASKADLQAACRLSERKVDRAIGELRDAGMITDRRESHLDNTRRWSVVYANDKTSSTLPLKMSPTVEDKTSSTPFSKKVKKNTSSKPGGFEVWWKLYPRKVGKADAQRIYDRLLREDTATELELLGALRAQVARLGKDLRFCPYPSTWLNQHRWEDPSMNGSEPRKEIYPR